MPFLKKITVAAVATVMTCSSAAATTLDFTTGILPFEGTEFGGWTLTFNPNAPAIFEAGDGVINLPNGDTLAGTTDGVGILPNDEIDGPVEETDPPTEWATLTFTTDVILTNVYGLDHFKDANRDADDQEEMRVTVGAVPGTIDAFKDATAPCCNVGFSDLETNLVGSVFTFWAGSGNDAAGLPNWALAGVTVQPIPLPASAFLLLGAVGGLAAMRRRKKT